MNGGNEDIIPKLKFISRLNKGDKINVKNMYIQQNNFIDKLSRSFFHIDDRTNTLYFVNNTIKKGFELFCQHIDSKDDFDTILCQNIYNDLKNSINGLLNLKETYIEDVMFTCKIDALIEEIEARLHEIQKKYNIKPKEDNKEKTNDFIKKNDKNDKNDKNLKKDDEKHDEKQDEKKVIYNKNG